MLNGEFSQHRALLEDAKTGDYGFPQLYEFSKAAEIQANGAPLALTLSQTPTP